MFSELTNSLYFFYVKLISLGGSVIFCLLTSFCLFPFHWLKSQIKFSVWYLPSMKNDVDKGIPFQLCYKQNEELLKGNPDSWFYSKKHQLKSKVSKSGGCGFKKTIFSFQGSTENWMKKKRYPTPFSAFFAVKVITLAHLMSPHWYLIFSWSAFKFLSIIAF